MTRLLSIQSRIANGVVRLAGQFVPPAIRVRFVQEWQAELAHELACLDGLSPLTVIPGVVKDALELRKLKFAVNHRRKRVLIVERFYSLARDIKVAVRSLLRSPLYAGIAVVTLALGIGGTSAAYTLLSRVVLDPLPYPNANRLVRLSNQVPGVSPDAQWSMSAAQYFYFSEHARTIESIGAYRLEGTNVMTASGPERATQVRVSVNLLTLLGAHAQVGRLLDVTDDQPGQPRVALLSDRFWRQLGNDGRIVGQTISMDGVPIEIVGVLEPGLALPFPGAAVAQGPDLWLPMQLDPDQRFSNSHVIPMIALLRNADPAEAESEFAQLTERLPEVFPNVYSQAFFDQYGFRTIATPLKNYVVSGVADALWTLTGALGLVLLIACANVTNLFLVRMEERKRELTVRTALGASLGSIARLVFAESLTLAFVGGALGLIVGVWAVPAMVSLAPTALPRIQSLTFGPGNALFTAGLSLIVGAILALVPIMTHAKSSRSLVSSGGRSSTAGRERQRLRSTLVVSQVALALTLVVAAGLLLASHRQLRQVDPGIQPEGVVSVQLIPGGSRYNSLVARWGLYKQIMERVRALPGVNAAGMTPSLPFSGGFGCTVQAFDDPAVYDRVRDGGMTTCAAQLPTTPGYLESMGIPILQGRGLVDADSDAPERGAVVVSRAFADRFWPGEDALSKRIAPSGRSDGPFYQVVGVTGDVYSLTLDGEAAIAVYYPVVPIPPSGGFWPSGMQLVIKTDLARPSSILPAVRQIVTEIEPTIPLANAQDMTVIIEESMGSLTFMSTLLQIAAGAALLLASVGLYGVISYLVTRRTKEIGMRIAMGARPAQVERLVVRKTLLLLILGVGFGVVLALLGTRVLQGFLYGVAPTSPIAFLMAIVVLTAVTLLASWVPARRAARIDPSHALRAE